MTITRTLIRMLEEVAEKEEQLEQMSIAWNGTDECERAESDPTRQFILEEKIQEKMKNILDFFDENMHPAYQSMRESAARYHYIRDHYEWRRYATDETKDIVGHAFIGCRFNYEDDFSAKGMLDYHIDKKLKEVK